MDKGRRAAHNGREGSSGRGQPILRGTRRADGGAHMGSSSTLLLVATGLIAGILSGFFGIGGGVIVVPALIYIVGFSQHKATGTSLAVLLPPIGLAAVLEYYRHGNVDLHAALIIALTAFLGAWLGAILANRLPGPVLRLCFGVFVVLMGFYLIWGALKRLGWI